MSDVTTKCNEKITAATIAVAAESDAQGQVQNNTHDVVFLDRLDNIIFTIVSKCIPYIVGPIYIEKKCNFYFCILYLSSSIISCVILYNRITFAPTFANICMILFVWIFPLRMVWHATTAFNNKDETNPFNTISQQLQSNKLWNTNKNINSNKKYNNKKFKIVVYCQFILFACAVIAGGSYYIYYTFVLGVFWGITWFFFIIIILVFWQHRLICKQLNISLNDISISILNHNDMYKSISIPEMSPSVSTRNSNGNIFNDHDNCNSDEKERDHEVGVGVYYLNLSDKLVQWFDNEYKFEWKVSMQDQIKPFNMTLAILFAGMFVVIWSHSSEILALLVAICNDGFLFDHFVIVYLMCTFVASLVSTMIVISLMCQSTKEYFEMKRQLNNIIIHASKNDNYRLFVKSTYCLKSMGKYSIKCAVYDYVIDWGKIFRLTVVFTISKIVIFFVASDFGGIGSISPRAA